MARQESYQGLARKWRPQRFEDLVGQEAVAQSFQSALRQDRVAHGHLLAGPRGVGKTTSARILAKALNCEQGPSPTPCGVCRHCVDITAGNDMDVIEIDAASNNSVDDVRELRERVIQAPFAARYKVYIIDEVHMLSNAAFNALLKTLEEPPAQVIFILATTELEKVPETIRSRCVLHTFRRMSSDDVARRLEQVAAGEGIQADPAELREVFRLIGRAVEGGMRDAMMAFDQILAMTEGKPSVEAAGRLLGLADQSTLVQTIDWLAEGKAAEILKLIEELSDRGRNLERFVKSLTATLRDLMLLQATANDALVSVSGEALVAAKQQARRLASATLFNMLNQLFELEARLKQSTQTRFLVEFTLLRIAAVRPVVPLDEILQRVQALPEAAFGGVGQAFQPASAPQAAPMPAPAQMQSASVGQAFQPVSAPQAPPAAPVIPVPRPAAPAPEPEVPRMAAVFGDSAPQATLAAAPAPAVAQPAPATPPAATPAALAGLGRDELLDLLVKNLPDTSSFLGHYLHKAAALRVEGATLRLEWGPESSFARKFPEKADNLKILEEVLTRLAGAPMHISNCDADPAARPQPAAEAKPAPARASMWANAGEADPLAAPLAAGEAADEGTGGEDDDAPAAYAPRRPGAAEAENAPAQPEAPPADTRSPLQKAQALIRGSDDAARRVKLLQEMLGGRLIDETGQPLPA